MTIISLLAASYSIFYALSNNFIYFVFACVQCVIYSYRHVVCWIPFNWIVAPLREKSEHLRPEILFLQIIFPLLFYILNIRWNSKLIKVFMVTFITKKGNLFFPIRKLDEQLNWIRESDFWPSFPKDKSKIDLVLLALNWLLHLVSICHWNYEYSHLRWNEQLFNQSLRTTGFVFSFWMVELFQHVSN